jgi:hypothetical protein
MNLTQYTPHWGKPKRSGAPHEIGKKIEKMSNFKLNSNFDWMKMKIGR